MEERDTDKTQELHPAGNTGNLYLSPEETIVLPDGICIEDVPIPVGKHSILPEDMKLGDAAFAPKAPTPTENEAEEKPEREPKPEPEPERQEKEPRKHRGLIVFVILLLTCALVAAAAWLIYQYRQHQEQLAPHPVWLQIDAPGYDLVDSKIPFHIEGVDIDGKNVDTVAFVGLDGTGIELSPGSYTVTVASSPLLDDAQFYEVPDTRATVEIPLDIEDGMSIAVEYPKFEFMFANPADITDEQIDLAYDYAIESGFDVTRADEYWDALVKKRDEALAVAQAAAEKAERIAAATEALEAKAKESGATGIGYQLADLDGDEMPELLLAGNSNSAVGAMCFVYAYDAFSHQVVELCSAAGGANHNPGIWYSTSTHEVVFATTGTNTETFNFYSVSAEVATLEYSYTHSWTQASGKTPATETFYIGSDQISEQAFSTMVNGLDRFLYVPSPAL